MKTACVVGGAGFVARHLIPLLTQAGYSVDAVDPAFFAYESRSNQSVTNFPCKFEDWIKTAGEEGDRQISGYDVIYHLGAHIQSIDEREKGDIEKYQDIGLDLAVMRYVAQHPPREAFIYPTSCATDSAATDPYAYSKTVGERMCAALHKQEIPVVILRPYSGYGHDQELSYPFPAILDRALRHENPLVVWGSGQQVRDWINVQDLARAFIWAIDKAPKGIAIDIGRGVGHSILNVASLIQNEVWYHKTVTELDMITGPRLEKIVGDNSKPSSSMRRVADTTLAKEHGFEAKVSLLEGIRMAVRARLKERVPA